MLENFKKSIAQKMVEYAYERDLSGEDFYFDLTSPSFSGADIGSNHDVILKHPLLTTAVEFTSQLFAQAEFWVENEKGEKDFRHKALEPLKHIDGIMSTSDFLEAVYFNKIGYGTAVVEKVQSAVGFKDYSVRILDTTKIIFPTVTKNKLRRNNFDNLKVLYDREGENREIPIKNLMFIRDLPISPSLLNVIDNEVNIKYKFISKSRLDGIRQTLSNTVTSLIAKDIILKTNGKEVISSKTGVGTGFPLSDTDKKEAQDKMDASFGLGVGRNRMWITKAAIEHKSLHIPIRDLGLDESVKTDANIIYAALDIPRDIKSIDMKKASYQNQKESMVAYFQTVLMPILKDFLETWNKAFEDLLPRGSKIVGSYDNLPIMKFITEQKYKGVEARAKALISLRNAGIPDDVALEMIDLDSSIKLKEVTNGKATSEEEQGNQQGSNGENEQATS